MKHVTLQSLTLCNFKGEKERTTAFNPDVTTISGGNGLGKSRHFDAFIWLLFGKDARDRKDYEIKTRINGEELHKCECSVAGVINVDGEEITLKRSFVEDWVKPRGQVEQVFKGNHTECWWNETPVNVGEFDKRIQAIVDSSVFKMITNPSYFASMKWQLQREQLFQLAGAISDEDIAAGNPDYVKLLDVISGKSLSDFKKELSAKKKRLNEELKQIQPRIDQTQKMMPAPEDFGALEKQLADIDSEIAEIDGSIADVNMAIRKQYDEERAKQERVNELSRQAQQLVYKAKEVAQDAAFEANARRREIANEINQAQIQLESNNNSIQAMRTAIEGVRTDIARHKSEQDELRARWRDLSAQVYNGGTTCSQCGQELPSDMIAKAQDLYDKAKAAKLEDITKKGREIGKVIAQLEEGVARQEESINGILSNNESLNNVILRGQDTLATLPEAAIIEVRPSDIPEWVELQKQIDDIKSTIAISQSSVNTNSLNEEKRSWMAKRDEVSSLLSKRTVIDRCRNEVEQLEAHGRDIAQQIADIEREEYIVEQFTQTKVLECEKRINAKFRHVSFRLFDYTLDGNPVETCIPLCNGVPYGSANTASQVIAGLDIINALCTFYGVSAPIFIDNRESVNEIIPMTSQLINLVVTNDTVLTVK